ncbi:MAG: beta-galactosidase [Flavobacteriales bacterium]
MCARSCSVMALLAGCLVHNVRSQSLVNGGFEGSFSSTAPPWYAITYGSPQYPSVSYGAESTIVHGGTSSQRIQVSDLGDGATLLVQTFDLIAGQVHEASVWLRAAAPMEVAFYIQERVPYYWVPAIAVVEVDTAWQRITIRGGFDRKVSTDATTIPARLVVEPLGTGTLYVDDAVFSNETDPVLNGPVTLTDTIPPRYFGMHVNKWGVHQTWPETGHGLMRLWNTGTTWAIMEPWQGALLDPDNWIYDPGGTSGFANRLDYYMDLIEAGDPTMEVIYTMGKTPAWAASSVALPPVDITWWQDYATVLGERFQGRIMYWEIWNEVDQLDYYGTLEELKVLTDSAASTLLAFDPDNRILSPNFTGAQQLAHFLKAGGGDNVDIISWHHYPGRMPEEMVPEIIGVRDVMARYGQAGKPLWNTEGAVSFMNGLDLAPDEQAGAVSRAYLVQWSFGVENFTWYCWDIFGGNSDYVDLSHSLTPSQYDSITPPGIAYQQTALWLKGAAMVSRTMVDGVWTIELARTGGYRAWVVWRPEGAASFSVPAEWDITHVRDLAGGSTAFAGGAVTIGPSPLLLEQGLITDLIEQPQELHCEVLPNPCRDGCMIRWPMTGTVDVELCDANGRTVRQFPARQGNALVFDRRGLSSGSYVVIVRGRHGILRSRMVLLE